MGQIWLYNTYVVSSKINVALLTHFDSRMHEQWNLKIIEFIIFKIWKIILDQQVQNTTMRTNMEATAMESIIAKTQGRQPSGAKRVTDNQHSSS